MARKLTKHETHLLERRDLRAARDWFEIACAASRYHSEIAARALAEHGDQGPEISGVVRDHFPEHVKETLRQMAAAVTKHTDAAYKLRPRGVRHSTMKALARAVAASRGSGFYGPQP
jgi:hypothetical protein